MTLTSQTETPKQDLSRLLSGGSDAIPLFKVFFDESAVQAAAEVLRCGFIGQGPRVEAFEKDLREWMTSPYILTLNSGTSALHLALRLSGVGPDTEVITTPMTCMATNVPIPANGAKLVWADINPKTGNICPKSVAEKITKKTKAVICVDWGGYPCDLAELKAVTEKHGIKLIEDGAHAFGATYRKQLVGGIADFTCFSLQAIKHVTTVDGGLLVCSNEEDYKRGKLLRWYGIDREGPRTDFRCEEDVLEYGYKFHMNDVTAAIGSAQLKFAKKILGAHRANASYYNERFQSVSGAGRIQLLDYQSDRVSSYWLYTFRVAARTEFMHFMKAKGVVVSQVHARNDQHTVFRDSRASLPGVDEFSVEQVSIPVGWWLTESQRTKIADAVLEYARG